MTDILDIIADDRELITYRPNLNKITGGVCGTILLQQILHRWKNNGRKPFYKFSAPCTHSDYREGDSWQEELGFSRSEFENARAGIASKSKKGETLDKTTPVIFWTDTYRRTWYNVNEQRLNEMLLMLYPALPNVENEHYLMPKSDNTYCGNSAIDSTETFKENTNTTASETIVSPDESEEVEKSPKKSKPQKEPAENKSEMSEAAQEYFKQWRRKRWKSPAERELFEGTERDVGGEIMRAKVIWAAQSGISNVKAICTAARNAKAGKTSGTNGNGKPILRMG